MTKTNFQSKRGYTLIELIIAVGIFALVMVLASGAYFMMINLNRQTQAVVTGINNLSYALETMSRQMRMGINYICNGIGDCAGGGSTLSFTDETGASVTYSLVNGSIVQTTNGVSSILTDPAVSISSLVFYANGTARAPVDYQQSRVTMIVSGTVAAGPGKTESFTVETGATMRGSDI